MPAVRVRGLNELVRAFGKLDKELRRNVQRELQKVAEPVALTARAKLARYRGAAISGIRPRVRGSTAVVQQSKGTVTGQHPEFGVIVMQKALIPALGERQADVVRGLENMLDRLGQAEGF